ncbi:hypothetical protein LCGC14_2479320, partial [marine sediment metagenome]
GVDGLEIGHTSHTPEQVEAYLRYARAKGLLVSGGTDGHFPDGLPSIGRHHCPDELAAPLLERLGM